MKDIMKLDKSLAESGQVVEGMNEAIKKERKEQIGGFLSMFLVSSAATLLENMLVGKAETLR